MPVLACTFHDGKSLLSSSHPDHQLGPLIERRRARLPPSNGVPCVLDLIASSIVALGSSERRRRSIRSFPSHTPMPHSDSGAWIDQIVQASEICSDKWSPSRRATVARDHMSLDVLCLCHVDSITQRNYHWPKLLDPRGRVPSVCSYSVAFSFVAIIV